MGLLLGEADHSYCRASAWETEYNSRRSIPQFCGCQQLEIGRDNIPEHQSSMGSIHSGSICRSSEHPTEQICQLETRPQCDQSRCISDELGRGKRICVPPILFDQSSSGEDQQGRLHSSGNSASMAGAGVVSTVVEDGSGSTDFIATDSQNAYFSQRRASSPDVGGEIATGSVEGVRGNLIDSQVSSEAQSIMDDARRAGTKKAYGYAWNKWSGWCNSRHVDPFQAPLGYVLNFLTEIFSAGLEYSTMNSYRSAISAKHAGINGMKIGQHPKVTALLKGMFNRRPPQPRYMHTWEVDEVLQFCKNWPNDEGLDLKQLSFKVTMLMALTGAMRQSELHLLRIDQMIDTGVEIKFHIGGLTKTRKTGQAPITVIFNNYPEDPKLDVASCIRAYIARTHSRRGGYKQLLISFVKPHKPIVSASIARWLLTLMQLAGIDTDKYKAHSTRGAATSKARRLGISVQEIMDRACWARESTFMRFYYRESEANTFQSKVLDST